MFEKIVEFFTRKNLKIENELLSAANADLIKQNKHFQQSYNTLYRLHTSCREVLDSYHVVLLKIASSRQGNASKLARKVLDKHAVAGDKKCRR